MRWIDSLGDQAVGTVRARDGCHGSASIVVACIPGDSGRAGDGGEEERSGGSELHFGCGVGVD